MSDTEWHQTGPDEAHETWRCQVDKCGQEPPRKQWHGKQSVTDEVLTALPRVGTPTSQYEELEFDEEPVGQVVEGEVWKGTFMPHARPDGPRVEMTISDENGVSITVAAEIDQSMRNNYDAEMLASDVHHHALKMYYQITGPHPEPSDG